MKVLIKKDRYYNSQFKFRHNFFSGIIVDIFKGKLI